MDLTQQETDRLKVIDAEYSVETGHKIPQPVVHLFCRDGDRNYRKIDVEGFRPYFYIEYEEFAERTKDVLNDRHVLAVEADLSEFESEVDVRDEGFESADAVAEWLSQESNSTEVYHKPDTFTNLYGEQLVKVYTVEPSHVGKIRDHWDKTYEADIPFPRRFLISSGVHLGMEIPSGQDRVRYENWDGHSSVDTRVQDITPIEAPDVAPRMLVADIEVRTNGGGVPDPANANNAITAITTYDNYTDTYAGWILESELWDKEYTDDVFESDILDHFDVSLDHVNVFDHETQMVESFHEWVLDKNFDVVTGWNSSGFDYPYIIQRSFNISAYSIREWDENGEPYNIGDEWPSAHIEGLVDFDMLEAYKKTQYRDLRSYKLDAVAEAELGMGKVSLEHDLDDAWHNIPVEFMRYNVRDVEAVVEIESASSLINLYDNMRDVTGALYNTCHHNGPMIDTLFLRQAFEDGVALPTNEKPDQGDYHGAWVAEPVPGRHENVVYPDLASLYPYIMWSLNISPETIYLSKEEYRDDGYDDDDVFVAYIDDRDWYTVSSGDSIELSEIDEDKYKGVHDESGSRKKKGSQDFDGIFDPQFTEIYFLKPSVKEGLIRKTIGLLVDLKYEYKGLGDMYSSVKRVTNCFTSDTEVVTPDGVRNIRDLEVGDEVYSIDNEADTVTTKPVTDVWSYPDYDGELVSIQNRHTDFKITPNHEMLVNRHRHTDAWESIESGNLNQYTDYRMPHDWSYESSSVFGDTIDLKSFIEEHTDRSVSVRTEDGIEYISAMGGQSEIERHIPTDDFVELLGRYTTEGGSHSYKISSHIMADLFEELCGNGSENKKLPEFVFDMKQERKQLLFDTLIRGDGDTNRGVRYTTVSDQLKDDFVKLCVHTGRNPRVREEPESSTNHLVYRILCSETMNSFRMHRDGSTDTAEDGVYCVTVKDNHTLMAGRNGNFQFTKQSVYGALGDSASGGKGFRLFDWRLAEAITLAGQKVINFTADNYIDLINDYAEESGYSRDTYLAGGDSVPSHEPTIVKKDGTVNIIPIEDVECGDMVWSDNGWTRVKNVIKKPNRKEMYTVQTKSGIVHVTEDHGLIDAEGNEQTPVETDVEDELLHKDIQEIDHDEISFNEKRAWLLGLFAAEGSCGMYECESGSKASWAINNSKRSVLEKAQEIMEAVFGIDTKIEDVRESSNTMKLRLHRTSDNTSVVLGFREMLYDGVEKRVPKEILNANIDSQKAFLAGYHTGDGHISVESKDFDEMWTKHRLLGCGIAYLLRQCGYTITVDVRTNQETEYFRIRNVSHHVGSNTEVRSITKSEYDGEYVYDLETENHHFHAGIGSMIVHNTDSVITTIPQAPDYQTALEWSQRASEEFQPTHNDDGSVAEWGLYDSFMHEEFNIIPGVDEHKMDVEIESLGSSLFFIQDGDNEEKAVKKRYAQHLIWDEDDGWIDTEGDEESDLKYMSRTTHQEYEDGNILGDQDPTDNIGIKGFEYVRSDSATVTKESQLNVLMNILLSDDPADRIHSYLTQLNDEIYGDEYDIAKLGRPKGINNPVDDYGWKTTEELENDSNYTCTEKDEENGGRYVSTPGPSYRGAKYADDHFSWEDIGEGSKPIRFYVDKVRGDEYPAAYEYESYPKEDRPDPLEVGRTVDAISVEEPDKLPDQFVLDKDKMVEKELKDKIQPILRTIGEDWDGMVGKGRQSGLDSWM